MDIKSKAIESTAEFSPCKLYRYELVRRFKPGFKMINFVMLNPSTADEFFNDPTISKCENRAIALEYDLMVITNLFAFRATEPSDMKAYAEPIGPENDKFLIKNMMNADMIVAAWGNSGSHMERSKAVKEMAKSYGKKFHYLKMNGTGEPSHPLYLSNKLELVEWVI